MSGRVELMIEERGEAGRVARVALDRPEKLNALSRGLMTEFCATFERLATDDGLRAVVLRGAGERAFCGGADIGDMAVLQNAEAKGYISLVHRVCDAAHRCAVPVIARIDGCAFGAGLELAASCDFRFASDRSTFGMQEVRLGIPSVVEAVRLPGLIGWGRTRLLLLTGRVIDAQTASRWGLVEELHPAAQLDAAIERCVDELLLCGPLAVRQQKRLILDWQELPPGESIARSVDGFAAAWGSDEPRERMRHFLGARHKDRPRG